MKLLLCIFALTAYVSAASISSLTDNLKGILLPRLTDKHIVGGESTEIEKHPYQVSLRKRYWTPEDPFKQWCGGCIFSERIILTAAHCVFGSEPNIWQVVGGSKYRNGTNGYIVPVEKIIIPENYVPVPVEDNDVAILVLGVPLPLNNSTMKVIKLAEHGPYEGEMATVTGFGDLKDGGVSAEILQEVKVLIIGNKACNEDYKGKITDSMLCAGYRGIGEKDACNGDSGGPLVVNEELAGIVSWGDGCAQPNFPGVYAKVSYLYPWIMKNINEIEGH